MFSVADWQIAASGPGGGSLVTADAGGAPRVFHDRAHFFVDWRCGPPQGNEQPAPKAVTTEGGFSVIFPGESDRRLAFSCQDRSRHQREGNQWNRTRVFSRAGWLVVELNGHELEGLRRELGDDRGPIGIRHNGGVLTFANLFVR